MLIQQIVDIPDSHRLFIDVPGVEELRAKLQRLRGCLSAGAFDGLDGVAYQRKVRDEWDAE